MNINKSMKSRMYPGKTLGALLIVLLLMPLGHALMILMEHYLEPTTLHYSAFFMGLVGLAITIWGVFVKGDTKQTCLGITGAMLFWTGWVEFLLAYYAQRYGVHCDLVGNGVVETVSRYVNGVAVDHSFTINGTPLEDFSRTELEGDTRLKTRISHYASHVRNVDNDHLHVCVLHPHWMQLHPLDTESLRRKAARGASPDGIPSQRSGFHGMEHYDVGPLYAAHVLLRPRILG